MTTVNVHEAKTTLSALLADVERGLTILASDRIVADCGVTTLW